MIPPDKLDVQKLCELIDPFKTLTSQCSDDLLICRSTDGVSIELIRRHLDVNNFNSKVYTKEPDLWTVDDHAARIAWLVKFGWNCPIEIDFGIPSLGHCWYPLIDGHHRFAAAIFKFDNWIMANCSGDVKEIEHYSWRDHDIHTQRDQGSGDTTP